MTLRELEAVFLKREPREDGRFAWRFDPPVPLAEADGVEFLCPECFQKNGGRVGTHICICWFRGKVGPEEYPAPGRWTPSGQGIDDLTFMPGEPKNAVSVLLIGGCNAHFLVVGGAIEMCNDSGQPHPS